MSDESLKKFQKEMNSGAVSLVILALIRKQGRAMYGYEIAKQLEAASGLELPMNQAAVYPVLRSLEKQGLLTSRMVPSDSGPPRKYYELTATGKRALPLWNKAGTRPKSLSKRFWRAKVNRPLPGPVLRYLRELEPLVKARVGVFVEQVLSDAREYLVNDYDALATSEPGLDDESVYHHFVENFGTPLQTASQYGEEHGVRRGNAPGWRICCTRCGKSAPATEVGITKIGARSYHSYKMCHCSHCRRLRWARLIRDLNDTNLTDRLAMGRRPNASFPACTDRGRLLPRFYCSSQ